MNQVSLYYLTAVVALTHLSISDYDNVDAIFEGLLRGLLVLLCCPCDIIDRRNERKRKDNTGRSTVQYSLKSEKPVKKLVTTMRRFHCP